METLTLNDGTVLENSSAIQSGDLFLYVNGLSMKDVFLLLDDQEKTEKIIYTRNNGSEMIYLGYEKLIAVRDEGNNLITAVLRREVVD